MTQPPEPTELETLVNAVYQGPLDEFVSRRDALVKQLRAAKRREDADRVKALRKPSRMAWVLDSVVREDPASIERLAAAIGAAQTVHSGADLRAAVEHIRAAVRDVAAAGARVAIRAGQPIDASALVTAVHAVIGETSAFDDLRAGRLVDVPAGGGLDVLSAITIHVPVSLPAAPAPKATPVAVPESPNVESNAKALAQQEADRMSARADLRNAESALADARRRSDRADELVHVAQTKLEAAEQALAHAHMEADARRADVEGARRDSETAAAHVRDAERAVDAARARLLKTQSND